VKDSLHVKKLDISSCETCFYLLSKKKKSASDYQLNW